MDQEATSPAKSALLARGGARSATRRRREMVLSIQSLRRLLLMIVNAIPRPKANI